MKELKTARPLVIVLIGLPGAGKSTFAREFSTVFGAPTIEVGLLQREIFGTKAPTLDQQDGVKRAYNALAAELFKSKRMFILDGNANTYADRSDIRALAKKAGYDVLFVWVQTSEPVARARATKPVKSATNLPLSDTAFTKAGKLLEAPRANEDHIVVSGQRLFASQVRPILKKIAEGHTASLSLPERGTRDSRDEPERPPRRNIFIR